MDKLINPTVEALSFMDEWRSSRPFITAKTSGSTGIPKEIKLLKSDMIVSAEATCKFFGINAESVLVCPLSANYIAGKMMIVRALVSGATLYFEHPSSEPLKTHYPEIHLLPIVPTQAKAILNSKQKIRNIIVGGAPLDIEIAKKMAALDTNVYATYGMTETCSHVALKKIRCDGNAVFKALPGIHFELDSRKCLKIYAPKFSFGQIITNDIVELINDTEFQWLGRYDNVIITGALKVFPEIVEEKLSSLVRVPFFVFGMPDKKWGHVVAICIENSNDISSDEDLIAQFHNYLSTHEIPRKIVRVKQIPRTASGKILRQLTEL